MTKVQEQAALVEKTKADLQLVFPVDDYVYIIKLDTQRTHSGNYYRFYLVFSVVGGMIYCYNKELAIILPGVTLENGTNYIKTLDTPSELIAHLSDKLHGHSARLNINELEP